MQLHLESDRQIVWQVSPQSPVVGLSHEVHYYVVWVYTEARTVLRAVVTDFFCNCWCLEMKRRCDLKLYRGIMNRSVGNV
jgi:hypothetical protein